MISMQHTAWTTETMENVQLQGYTVDSFVCLFVAHLETRSRRRNPQNFSGVFRVP